MHVSWDFPNRRATWYLSEMRQTPPSVTRIIRKMGNAGFRFIGAHGENGARTTFELTLAKVERNNSGWSNGRERKRGRWSVLFVS